MWIAGVVCGSTLNDTATSRLFQNALDFATTSYLHPSTQHQACEINRRHVLLPKLVAVPQHD